MTMRDDSETEFAEAALPDEEASTDENFLNEPEEDSSEQVMPSPEFELLNDGNYSGTWHASC